MATPRSNIVRLRLTDLEKADWQRAAGGKGQLSDWIRLVCNTAAAVTTEPSVQTDASHVVPGAYATKQEVATVAAARVSKNEDACPRAFNHRPGVYCGSCKKVATKKGE